MCFGTPVKFFPHFVKVLRVQTNFHFRWMLKKALYLDYGMEPNASGSASLRLTSRCETKAAVADYFNKWSCLGRIKAGTSNPEHPGHSFSQTREASPSHGRQQTGGGSRLKANNLSAEPKALGLGGFALTEQGEKVVQKRTQNHLDSSVRFKQILPI